MSKGLALDASNDIIVGGSSFSRVSNLEYVAQKIRSKLQLIEGESQLDRTAGIAYFTDIFVKPVDLGAVVSIFKSEILNTEGVNELLKFEFDLDTTERKLTISFTVNTIYGDTSLNNLTINMGV